MTKMTKFTRILSCIFLFVMCFISFSSCNKPDLPDIKNPEEGNEVNKGNDGNKGNECDKGDDKEDPVYLVKDGVPQYAVVRPDDAGEVLSDGVKKLNAFCREKFGVFADVKTDWVKGAKKGSLIDNDDFEILIGRTNRRESFDEIRNLKVDEYFVKLRGNKIVILGFDDYCTSKATFDFISKIREYTVNDGKDVLLERDFLIEGTNEVRKIKMHEGSDIRIMTFNILGSGNDFQSRKPNVLKVIFDYLPDVIGFQEANSKTHSEILRSSGVKEFYDINEGFHKKSLTANYTPILFLKRRFEKIEGGVEWLDSRYTGTNTKSLSWVVLKEKESGRSFAVVNMHGAIWSEKYKLPDGETLVSMKNKAAYDWKIDNVRQMTEKIDSIRKKYGDIAVFTTGDYNFTPSHAAFRKLTVDLKSSHKEAAVKGNRGESFHHTVGEMPNPDKLPIDLLLFDPKKVDPLYYDICVRESDLQASDHSPVYAEYRFK